MPVMAPEDFGDALLDLQAALPSWWQTRNPDSVLYGLLVSMADAANRLAQTWWQTLQDQTITTASREGLLANFAFAWGLQAEEDALGEDGLRAYIEARAQEDGSVRSLENTLRAILGANPVNQQTGVRAQFGTTRNLCPTPTFAGGIGEWEEEAPPGCEVTSEIVTDWHGPHTTHSLLVKARLPDGGPAQALTPASVACHAYGAAFSPDGLDLYAAASPNLTHFRRNAETGLLTEVGPSPGNASEGVAVSPDGKSVYACSGGTHLYVYDRNVETGVLTFRESVNAGEESDPESATRRVAVSGTGTHVYVTNQSKGAARGVWSFSRNSETGALALAGHLVQGASYGLALAPDGSAAYVTSRWNPAADELHRLVIDSEGVVTAAGATVSCGNGVRDVACAPDGAHLYVGAESAGLQVFDAATLTLIETITSGLVEPCGVCVSPHGGAVYAGNESGVGQFWRNKQTGKLTAMTPENAATGGHIPRLPVVSPDGRHLYCTEDHAEGGIRQYLRVETWETAGPRLKTAIPVTPGEKISFGMLMNVLKTPPAEPTVEAKVWVLLSFDDAEGKYLSAHNDPIEFATGEHRVNGEYWEDIEVPAGAASLHIATVLDAGEAIGQEAEWKQDEIQLDKGATLGEYSDGSMTGYGWAGEEWKSATIPALRFPSNGEGIQLWQLAPGETVGEGLYFPANGEGLQFPGGAEAAPAESTDADTGQTAPGAPSAGLRFATNEYVEILPNTPEPHHLEVRVLNWLAFDRPAFQRAVERFTPADCYPAVIREVPVI